MDDEIVGMDLFSPEMMENLRKVSKGLNFRRRLKDQESNKPPCAANECYMDDERLVSS